MLSRLRQVSPRCMFPSSNAAALALLIGLAVATWLRFRHENPEQDDWAWPMAASLAFAPMVYPWYMLWLIPFLRKKSSAPLFLWSVTILASYFVWSASANGS